MSRLHERASLVSIGALAATAVLAWSCTSAAPRSKGGSGDGTTGDDGSSGSSGSSASNGSSGGPGASGPGVVLRGGSIVDPASQTITQGDVFMCGGVIVDAQAGATCATQEIDATGKFIIPGLVDMHVHARGMGMGNGGFLDMTIDAEAAVFRKAGVVAFLDSMNDEAKIFPARDEQRAQPATLGADIFCVGAAFTPSGGHGTEYELPATSYRIVDTVAEADRQVDDLATHAPDVVKIMYDHRGDGGGPDVGDGHEGALGVAMSKPVMQEIVARANAHRLKTQVHVGTWSDALAAIDAGATIIAHLGEPVIPAGLAQHAHDKGVYWIPTMELYHGLPDLIADQTLLDDPLLAKVAPPAVLASYRTNALDIDADTTAWLARHTHDVTNLAALVQAGVQILAGTDVVEYGMFPGWSLHRELVWLVKGGLTSWQALASATTRPGAVLGRRYGVTPGSEASVVVLDASPIDDIANTRKVHAVIHHGQLVPLD